jgi:hypothetical protein
VRQETPFKVHSEVLSISGFLLLVLIAVIGGVAVTLQGQFMGLMDQGIGTRDYTPNPGFSGNDSFVSGSIADKYPLRLQRESVGHRPDRGAQLRSLSASVPQPVVPRSTT